MSTQANIGPAPATAKGPDYFPNIPGVFGSTGPQLILSVWPLPLMLSLRHAGSTTYEVEAAPKGEFKTLVVRDTVSFNRNFNTGQYYAAPVPSGVVVENLLHAWTRGLVGTKEGLGPGIIHCEGAEPTAEEIQFAKDKQAEYFRFLISEGDLHPERVTDLHKLAADWMGVHDRKWAQRILPVDLKPCPACGEEIRAIAVMCRFCGTDLEAFAAKHAGSGEPTKPQPKEKRPA